MQHFEKKELPFEKFMELALSWLDKHEGKAKHYYEKMYHNS